MMNLKTFGLAVLAAAVLTAVLGAAPASASCMKIRGAASCLSTGTGIEATLESGTSLFFEDQFGFTIATCTGSTITFGLERVTPTGQPKGKVSGMTFSGCPAKHDVTLVATGEMEFRNIAGTTNATMFSYGAKIKLFNTLLNQTCTANTDSGTDLGVMTGASTSSAQATIDVNSLIKFEGCAASNGRLTGAYSITKPVGLVSEAS